MTRSVLRHMSTSDKNQNSVKRSSRNCTRRYRAESAVPTFWVENVFCVCFLIDRVELNGRGILVILRYDAKTRAGNARAGTVNFSWIRTRSFLFLMTGRRDRDVCKIWAGYVSISKSYDQNKFSISICMYMYVYVCICRCMYVYVCKNGKNSRHRVFCVKHSARTALKSPHECV